MLRILVALCTFGFGVFINNMTQVEQTLEVELLEPQQSEFKLIVPKSTWEPIFFKTIDRRARDANLTSLRVELRKHDLEIRLWNGFGLTLLEGFVLRRVSGQWSAVHLAGRNYQTQLSVPKSGWNECWRKLVALGILKLPDAEKIHCSSMINDGMSYVVEINHENTYRTYLYDNPSYAKCEQAKMMISIGNTIAEEFNLPEMKTRK